MRWLRRLWARIRYRNFDAELREELATHSPGDVVLPLARPVGNRPFTNAFTYAEYAYLRDHTETLAGLVGGNGIQSGSPMERERAPTTFGPTG